MKIYIAGTLVSALLLTSCGGNTPVGQDPMKKKNSNRQKVENVKVKTYPSEEWLVVSFGIGELGWQTPEDEVMLKGDYSFVRPFSEKHASVRVSGNMMGLINEQGDEVIPFEYNYVSSLKNGLFAVRKESGGKVGYMNLKGDYVVEPTYDMGFAFQGKRARVAVGYYQDMLTFKYSENCKYGFIDENGEEVIEAQYEWAGDFADGIAPVAKNGRYFFINEAGEKLDNETYSRLSGFREDLCWVKKGNKGGFINRNNEVVIPFEYSNHMYFFSRGSRFGSMNNESEIGATRFLTDDDVMFLSKGEHKWGIVDIDNNELTPFEYSGFEVPEDGYIEFEKRDKLGFGSYKKGVIKEIVPAKFDYIYYYPGNDHIEVGLGDYNNRKVGIYGIDGAEWVPAKYDDVDYAGNGVFGVKFGDKWAILKGDKLITEPIYDYIGDNDDGKTYATRDDVTVYINENGTESKTR